MSHLKLPTSDRVTEWSSFPAGSLTDVKRELLASWFAGFEWDAFATYTFATSGSAARSLAWARRHLHQLNTLVRRSREPGSFGRWARKPYTVVFHEVGPRGARGHLHALVGNLRPFPAYCGHLLPPGVWAQHCCLTHSWLCGGARAFPYDRELGATHYVTKYTVKDAGEWCFIGTPTKIRA